MAVIKIKIMVSETSSVMALFDHIEVQRSVVGPPSFPDAVLITKESPTAAQIQGSIREPFPSLQAKQFKFTIGDGDEQTATFTASDPSSLVNVLHEFNSHTTGVVASNDGTGRLKLETVTLGTQGVIEVTGGLAVDTLGFMIGQKDNGEDEYIQLMPDVTNYEYQDRSGLISNYYRTRYLNVVSGEVSSWSDWIMGSTGAAVADNHLIIGKVKVADVDGTALVGMKVTAVNVFQPVMQDGYFMAGRCKTVTTDSAGQAQITLIKGATVDVILEGTSVIRRILVPSTGTEFDLLASSLQLDDPFGIQVPDLPAASRSS